MNQNLPIASFREQIVDAVAKNPVVIITAETGAGKSTQVPQYLLEAGYNIVVTQPRRLAARTVANRVATEMSEELGATIGLRTRDDYKVGQLNRCLFATDGLALIRELMGVGKHDVLVLDEVHEWNLNIEVLVAWTKLQISKGANFKVVLMSATLEAEALSDYFDNAPIITVPGRQFTVEVESPRQELVDDVADLLKRKRNVLVFMPGKAEISKTIDDLKDRGLGAEILALHGEMTPDDQARCFRNFGRE